MKNIATLFLVALFAGAITLGSYLLFFDSPDSTVVTSSSEMPVITTSGSPSSLANKAIEDVDFTIAAEKTVNAVVHVKNLTISKGSTSIFDFFYGSEGNSRPQLGSGSGVIISPDGYIVTNNHVIDKAKELHVTLNNNGSYEATVVGADPATDIALIKIEPEQPLPYLAFGDSDNTKIGEWVLAVGNPFNLTSTVTAGIVSAKARNLGRNQSFLQTDAAVNPGNSGGALVNTNGDLIGINTAITSQTGSYVGYSFAVPSNLAKKVIEDIMEFGNVQKGILGITTVRLNTQQAFDKGVNEIDGVYIDSIEDESGADDAGLQTGDVIKKVDDIRVRRFGDLTGYVSTKRPGDKVEVTINRKGRNIVVPVVLKKRQSAIVPGIGIEVRNLSDSDKRTFKVKNGVKITGVPERYQGYGLDGKVVIQIDDEIVRNIDDANRLFSDISRYERFSITLIDDEGERERLIFQ
ncbi:MAG: trypsin-like peptidase domain-containing protein [Bacteroidia bacterium]|nr:trypsin-like peptidase domain-containing protein [Bacteroidia bacterium]